MGVLQSEITPEARAFLQLTLKLDDLLERLLATFVKSYAGAAATVAYMDSAYAFFATQIMLQDMRMEVGYFDPNTGERTTFERNTGLLDEFGLRVVNPPRGGNDQGQRRRRSPGGSAAAARERAIERERDRLRKLIAEILAQLRAIFTDGV